MTSIVMVVVTSIIPAPNRFSDLNSDGFSDFDSL